MRGKGLTGGNSLINRDFSLSGWGESLAKRE